MKLFGLNFSHNDTCICHHLKQLIDPHDSNIRLLRKCTSGSDEIVIDETEALQTAGKAQPVDS